MTGACWNLEDCELTLSRTLLLPEFRRSGGASAFAFRLGSFELPLTLPFIVFDSYLSSYWLLVVVGFYIFSIQIC